RQLDGPRPGVPLPPPVTVPRVHPLRGHLPVPGPADALDLGVHHPLRETPDHLPQQIGTRRLQRVLESRASDRHNVTHGHLVLPSSYSALRRITRWPPHVAPTRPARTKRSELSRYLIHHSSGREPRFRPPSSPFS